MMIDPMFSTGSFRAGLPELLSPGKSKNSGVVHVHVHDIEADNWLSEIGMSQYLEVMLINFSESGSRLLNRKRLAQVRIDSLPKMGITQYHHQKLILEHIRHTLQFEFHSPARKREVAQKMESVGMFGSKFDMDGNSPTKVKMGILPHIPEYKNAPAKKYAEHNVKAAPTRRRSFDKNVWQSISKLRTSDAASLAAVEALRSGHFEIAEKLESKTEKRRRRRSFEAGVDPLGKNKGAEYGNKAQHFDLMSRELEALQANHLNKLKRLVKCEHATIYFLNEKTRDLLLVTEACVWFRIGHGSGIAGYCVEHGVSVNLNDAYSDLRFNSNLDEKTGWKTRNILCQPLRGQRGGGTVIGAVQCINKADGNFDSSDEEHMAVCCQRIADDLHVQFHDLLNIAEAMSGISIFVGEKGGHALSGASRVHSVAQPTQASILGHREKETHISEPIWHS